MSLFASNADFTYMGVSFSERIYFSMSAATLLEPLAVMLVVSFICGLWPAAKSIGVDVAPSIAGRN
jgi:ABC-type antimicrobial peptide transport system permease subunit